MAAVSSYDPARTTAGELPGEVARLEAQAALTFDAELRVLGELGLAAGRHPLAEVGADTGALARRLAGTLPGALVIAIDADTGLLGHLPPGQVRRIGGDAGRLPLADGTVSGLLYRYVLQHLPDPVAALREARRVLRPGGRVYVTEVDGGLWGLAEPADPALASVHARAAASQHRAGGDRLIGRKLSPMLRAAGFRQVSVRPFAVTSDDRPVGEFAPHLGPDRLAPLVADGALSVADLARAAASWARFRADPRSWVMLIGLVAAGTAG